MTYEEPTCRMTFTGNALTKQHWFEATWSRSMGPDLAQDLQRRQGFDPDLFGFTNFQQQKRNSSFVARWACSSEPKRPS